MKVPHEITGRTQPSSRGLDYFRDTSDLAAGGLQRLASAIGGLGQAVAAHQQKTEAFSAEAGWNDFETDLAVRQTNNLRETDPSDPTFVRRSEEMFDNFAGQYLTKVPPALRPQYEARIAQKRQEFVLGTYKADLTMKDGWQSQKIVDDVTKGQLEIEKDWSTISVDKVRKRTFDLIDASTLSEQDKIEKKRQADLLYLQQQYKKAILENTLDGNGVTGRSPEGKVPITVANQAGRLSKGSTERLKPELLDRWQQTLNRFGRSVPIVSGYRDPDKNKAAGGASKSRHLHGDAIDVDVSGMPQQERVRLIQEARAAGFTGVGVYKNSLHFDLGGDRAWGPDHSSKSLPSWAAEAVRSKADNSGGFDSLWAYVEQRESGGRQSAVSPKGAIGVAQVMPTTGPEAAKLAGLPWDEAKFRTDANYNRALGQAYLKKQLQDFGGDTQKALAAYNAGPGAVRNAVKLYGENWLAHMPNETKAYVGGHSGGNSTMAAPTFSIDDDPRFAMLPLEIREATKADALRLRNSMLKEREAADKEAYDAFLNQKQLQILKGEYGKADMFADFEAGRIRDYGDLRSLEEHFDKRNKMDEDLMAGRQSLIQGRAPTDGQFNAVAKERGWVDRLWNLDKEAANEIWQTAARVDDTAPVVRNALGDMLGNRNLNTAQFAYDVLKGLYTADADGNSFKKLPEDVKAKSLLYNELTKSMNAAEAIKMIRGGDTPDEVFKTEQLREQAKKTFTSSEIKGHEIAQGKLNSLLAPWTARNASLTNKPTAELEFMTWYQTWWTENYIKSRDASAATNATNELADKVWTVSNVGNAPQLMMYAPESIGLPKFQNSYDWLKEQAYQQLGILSNASISLVADDLTRTEIANWQAGGSRQLSRMEQWGQTFNDVLGTRVFDTPQYPSWKAIVTGPDGLPRLGEKRIRFSPTPELVERDEAIQRFEDIEDRWLEMQLIYDAEKEDAQRRGVPLDPAIQRSYDEINQQYEAARDIAEPPNLAPGIAPERVADPAGEFPQFGTEPFTPGPVNVRPSGPRTRAPIMTYPPQQLKMTAERFGISMREALKLLRDRNIPRMK